MSFTYSEFATTPANLVADLKAKILLSSDYTNPTGQVVLATTPLGAKIAVDLNAVAPTTQKVSPGVWRAYAGTTGTDQYLGRNLWFKRVNSGATGTISLHVRVAAGNTLLYVDIEGPYASENFTDSVNYGSHRSAFAVAQLTPYFTGSPADAVPAVVLCGSASYTGYDAVTQSIGSQMSHVSRNMADTASWSEAHLETLDHPTWGATVADGLSWNRQALAADGNTYLAPYVLSEHIAGMRGRLTDLFFGGFNNPSVLSGVDPNNGLQQNDIVTYGGNTYKMLAPYKTDASNASVVAGSFGYAQNQVSPRHVCSPLVAVRIA